MKPIPESSPHMRRRSQAQARLGKGLDDSDPSSINPKEGKSMPAPQRLRLHSHKSPMLNTRRCSLTGSTWLAVYFVLNLTLTLYNKVVLNHFPFPYTLTALHALCGTIGTFTLLHWNPVTKCVVARFKRIASLDDDTIINHPRRSDAQGSLMPPIPKLRGKELVVLLLYSCLYSVNIAISNVSLRLVTVPFHQVVRASAPFFTVALSALLLGKYSSRAKMLTLLPVMAGVGLATYGDYYFTPKGFFLTVLGTVLAALKTITTNLLQKTTTDPPHYPSPTPPMSPFFPTPTSPISEKRGNGHGDAVPRIEVSGFDSTSSEVKVHDVRIADVPQSRSLLDRVLPYERQHTRLSSLSPMAIDKSHRFSWSLPRLTLTSLQLLYLLSPIAFVQTTFLAHISGELTRVNIHLNKVAYQNSKRDVVDNAWDLATSPRFWLLLNGIIAFALNVVSFNANRKVGPLAMSVSANVKQVLSVICSVALFNLHVTVMNGTGIFLTLLGGAWYAGVELREKRRGK